MRKLLTLVVMMVVAVAAMAQSTNKISYQAVIRDSHNRLVVTQPVSVTVTITDGNRTYTENLSGTTNANGLLSLEIGGGNGFDAIDWSNALITTTTTIGNETVEDQVHVTAVPFALSANYATDINPNAPTITAIYNNLASLNTRMINDSLALVNGMTAVNTKVDNLAISVDTAKANMRSEAIQAANLLNTKVDNLAISVDTAKANMRSEAIQAANLLNTKVDNLAISVDTAKTNIRNEIGGKANSTDVYTKTEVDELLAQQRTAILTTLNTRIDSVINVMNNLPTKMVEERDTVQTAGQTQFTLAHEARTDCIVRIYINGVMVGGNHNGVVTVANSNNHATVTYVPAQNGNYELKANDVVTIVYWLLEANSNSSAIIPGGN